ncbi:MAG: hypothetical protein B7733_25525 [Myxococcales bacterium FL481]|nr:MAG: hypothetical protein B7733_25525 [Myxococcales bacterium FL481]
MALTLRVEVLGRLPGVVAVVAATATLGCLADDHHAEYLVERADAVRGGLLWDRFWEVPDVREPVEPGAVAVVDGTGALLQSASSLPVDNPLYLDNPAANQRRGADTWRCAECHGWDYLGEAGEYGRNSHRTGFPGVWSARKRDVGELFEVIAEGGPGHTFTPVLSNQDIADVVKFVREGTVHRDEFVHGPGIAHGVAARGQSRFEMHCVGCHGDDGRQINLAEGEVGWRGIGDVGLEEPGRFVHKVRLGQPDGSMPSARAINLRHDDVSDLLTYAQALGQLQQGQQRRVRP